MWADGAAGDTGASASFSAGFTGRGDAWTGSVFAIGIVTPASAWPSYRWAATLTFREGPFSLSRSPFCRDRK